MSDLQISYFGATDAGRIRSNNEDVFIAQTIWDERHFLLAAIDGMGGEEGGEIAAEIAKESIIKYLSEFQNDKVLNLIKRAVADANNEIIRQKEVHPQYRRMGCVATAGIIDLDAQTLSIAHVGDSRLYRYSNGELSKLTHDHSLVGYQEEQGILTEEQAMKHPRRSVIERCLGNDNHLADDKSFIEASVFPLINGETFIFCSDGLCDVLTSTQIAECIQPNRTPEDECKVLIDKANEAGGKDNITVVIAQVSEVADVKNEKPTNNVLDEKASYTAEEIIGEEPAAERKSKSKLKWIAGIIVALVCCTSMGFFIGKQYSRSETDLPNNQEEKPLVDTNDTILSDSLANDTVTKPENDSITTSKYPSHE